MAADGQSGAEIAAVLNLSEGTVRNYLSETLGKLGARNRVEAARIARMKGWTNGPNIPDELLEQRDLGKVVFFCGAGVSMPAGLPNFTELIRRVIRTLGTEEKAPSRTLFERREETPSLDRVFNLLQQEYSRGEIDSAVTSGIHARRRSLVSKGECLYTE